MRYQTPVLLHVTDPTTEEHWIGRSYRGVTDLYLSTVGLDQAIEAPKKCRLARPTLSDQRNGAPRRHIEIHIAECDSVPE